MFIKDIFKTDNKEVKFIGWVDKDGDKIFMRDNSSLKRIRCFFKENIDNVKLKVKGMKKKDGVEILDFEVLKEPYITFEQQKNNYLEILLRRNIYDFFLETGYYELNGFTKTFEEKENNFKISLTGFEIKEVIHNIEYLFKYCISKSVEKNILDNHKVIKILKDAYLVKEKDKILRFVNNEIDCGNIVISDKKEEKILSNGVLLLNEISNDFSNVLIDYLIKEFGEKPFFIVSENKIELFVPEIGIMIICNFQEKKYSFELKLNNFIKVLKMNLKE